MDPALLSLLAGSLVALLVRVISNKRVQLLQKALDQCRDTVIRLEKERYRMRRELARHGIEVDTIMALPAPEEDEEEENESGEDEEISTR